MQFSVPVHALIAVHQHPAPGPHMRRHECQRRRQLRLQLTSRVLALRHWHGKVVRVGGAALLRVLVSRKD